MKIGFAGTSEFAAEILKALIEHKITPQWVISTPDSIAQRGQKLVEPPVKKTAEHYGLKLFQPQDLRQKQDIDSKTNQENKKENKKEKQKEMDRDIDKDLVSILEDERPDIIVVVAYGKILPASFINIPKIACVNIHTSLLPRWRGAAPIERAIEAGDTETGISIFQLEEGLDTGPIILQKSCRIEKTDTSAGLSQKLLRLAKAAILEYLAKPKSFKPRKQAGKASYANKINKEEAQINWQEDAASIARRINAFNPKPGAYSSIGEERVKLLQALVLSNIEGNIEDDTDENNQPTKLSKSLPGSFSLENGELLIRCGKGVIKVLQVQFAGKKPISPADIQGKSPLNQTGIKKFTYI